MSESAIKRLYPPSTIGIVGGGQLGKMMAAEAKRMGYNVVVLDPKVNAPAGQVSDKQIQASFDDINGLRELAKLSDVLTYEFEHINVELLEVLEKEGHKIYPSAATLKIIQDKFVQKTMLKEIDIPVPDFYRVSSYEELEEIFQRLGKRIIFKTCKGGYDGKGNIIIDDESKLKEAYETFYGSDVMVEEFIEFSKEVSVLIARNEEKTVVYPVADNHHKNSILIKSLIPAEIKVEVAKKTEEISEKVINAFKDYGLFCIEFFVDKNDRVLVNEIAPRPHNSGHYTIEACISSQYEQVIRILTGMPLGSTKLRHPCVMYNILGSQDISGKYNLTGIETLLNTSDAHLHLYGKPEGRPGQKLGHITALGESLAIADVKAKTALDKLKFVPVND